MPNWVFAKVQPLSFTCASAQEWMTPQPSRRPDVMPEFEKLETPMPRKLPGDPEIPDEEEEVSPNGLGVGSIVGAAHCIMGCSVCPWCPV